MLRAWFVASWCSCPSQLLLPLPKRVGAAAVAHVDREMVRRSFLEEGDHANCQQALVCDLLDVADRELDKALPRLVSAAILC